MSDFAKIHRKFYEHPKVKRAGLEAIGLWAVCNAHCRDHRTGGFVSYAVAANFDPTGALTNKLVEVHLWIPVTGGYKYHSWIEWNSDDHKRGTAGDLIDQAIPRSHPQVTRGALEKQVAMLLDEGTDTVSITEALKKWLARPGSGASLLPFLVSDVLRERAEDDINELLNEAWQTGDIHKLARRGMIFTPSDSEPEGLTLSQLRDFNLAEKRSWLESKQKELKHAT